MPSFDRSKLAEVAGKSASVNGYRNQATGFDPRSGEGARRFGGRFNRPHSYPAVYLCTTQPCVVAELTRQARRQGLTVEDLLPRELRRACLPILPTVDRRERNAHQLGHSGLGQTKTFPEAPDALG